MNSTLIFYSCQPGSMQDAVLPWSDGVIRVGAPMEPLEQLSGGLEPCRFARTIESTYTDCSISKAGGPRIIAKMERTEVAYDDAVHEHPGFLPCPRAFGLCRHCRGPMSLRAVVVNPPATTRILDGLARAHPPPVFVGACR